ncbi:MAG: hypothetical protein ABI882_06025 [Acidobacteriota bacterium]
MSFINLELEVIGYQVSDVLAFLIGDDDIYLDQLRTDPDDVRVLGPGRLLVSLLGCPNSLALPSLSLDIAGQPGHENPQNGCHRR